MCKSPASKAFALQLFSSCCRPTMLTIDECVEIMLLSGREGYSHRDVARHPEQQPVSQSTVSHLLEKFKITGCVADAPRSGWPSTSTEVEEIVLAKVMTSPKKSTRRTSFESGNPRTTLQRVLKKHQFHSYKLHVMHYMTEDDPDHRFLEHLEEDKDFLSKVTFSDEANFYVNGEVNRESVRYWCNTNPHWLTDDK
ncbi:hypothetical protein PR048_010965 [Dryococelus australis]|uniref:Transposase n=1 Tax=Dryococelus australis TaxID=614101 RepID=A0ABQ9HKS0_9NEOP|nr:hypothetical protein PR048_010965 [Dryococelus australis]